MHKFLVHLAQSFLYHQSLSTSRFDRNSQLLRKLHILEESNGNAFLLMLRSIRMTENKEKGVQVWLDKNLKNKLDRLKASGIELPVKHLLSAALRVFLEDNEKYVNEQLSK